MDEHFRAFSFVDRIDLIGSDARIRGSYTIPMQIETFPSCLVVEAVAQLAAWGAMAALDFRCRPVAGLAGRIELLSAVLPGQTLELAADLETVDTEAVAYAGSVQVDGIPVIGLQHCIGPMVRTDEFDDPQALRDRFALLQAVGATPGGFGGLPSFPLDHRGGEHGQSLGAELRVPVAAAFFKDHFPRRPVFPGSLLIQAKLELVSALATQWPTPANGGRWTARSVADVKLRAFIPPGDTLALEARLNDLSADTASVTVETRNGKRLVGSARVRLARETSP